MDITKHCKRWCGMLFPNVKLQDAMSVSHRLGGTHLHTCKMLKN